jgi:hypothetical protein
MPARDMCAGSRFIGRDSEDLEDYSENPDKEDWERWVAQVEFVSVARDGKPVPYRPYPFGVVRVKSEKDSHRYGEMAGAQSNALPTRREGVRERSTT